MNFKPLTPRLITTIEAWFDDLETIRYLGGREWVKRELELMREAPRVVFKGRTILDRYAWVVFNEAGHPIGLIDVEPYSDGTAGMAFVVAPHVRGQGVGQRMLLTLVERPELTYVHTIIGGVEPENKACQICLTKAGFTIAQWPDEEGMLRVEKKLH